MKKKKNKTENHTFFSKETKKNLHTATLTQTVSFWGLFPPEKQTHMNLMRLAFLAKQGSSEKNIIPGSVAEFLVDETTLT